MHVVTHLKFKWSCRINEQWAAATDSFISQGFLHSFSFANIVNVHDESTWKDQTNRTGHSNVFSHFFEGAFFSKVAKIVAEKKKIIIIMMRKIAAPCKHRHSGCLHGKKTLNMNKKLRYEILMWRRSDCIYSKRKKEIAWRRGEIIILEEKEQEHNGHAINTVKLCSSTCKMKLIFCK